MISIPSRLKKPCAYDFCENLVTAGTTYCEKHQGVVKKKRDQLYDRYERDEKSKKFYNSLAWKKLRKIKISKEPLCEICEEEDRLRPATEVDHIVPIKVDWSRRLDEKNLQSLCHRCHMRKTAAENG